MGPPCFQTKVTKENLYMEKASVGGVTLEQVAFSVKPAFTPALPWEGGSKLPALCPEHLCCSTGTCLALAMAVAGNTML